MSLLLAQVVPPARKDPKADTPATLAHFAAIGQQADGSWKYAGQVQKRPDQFDLAITWRGTAPFHSG